MTYFVFLERLSLGKSRLICCSNKVSTAAIQTRNTDVLISFLKTVQSFLFREPLFTRPSIVLTAYGKLSTLLTTSHGSISLKLCILRFQKSNICIYLWQFNTMQVLLFSKSCFSGMLAFDTRISVCMYTSGKSMYTFSITPLTSRPEMR